MAFLSNAIGVMKSAWDGLIGVVRVVIGVVAALTGGLLYLLNGAFSPLMPTVTLIVDILKVLGTTLSETGTALMLWMTGLISTREMINKSADAGRKMWAGFWQSLKNFDANARQVFDGMVRWVRTWPIVKAFADVLNGVINTVRSAFKSVRNVISDALDSLRFWKSSKKETSVSDAVIKPDGSIIRTDPADYLFATKNPQNMRRGGGTVNFSPTINVNANVSNQMDIRMLAEQLVELSNQELTRRTNDFRL